jgi:hypothetical protein
MSCVKTSANRQDLLLSPPLSLPATTVVKCLFASNGQSLGLAIIEVVGEADAESIRKQYSGESIDESECKDNARLT